MNRYTVHAPYVARAWRPRQFVIVRPREDSERIRLTIADADTDSIELIVQEVGKTTAAMADRDVGEILADVCGPLGEPARVERVGSVVVVGGGIGIAPAWPIARALRAADNHVTGVLGARTSELLILEEEMRRACDRVVVVTDDGSRGERGFVTSALERLLSGGRADQVFAVGPPPMMKAVAEVTRSRGVRTVVSLNTVMVDGTGMCGGCRVQVGGETRFARIPPAQAQRASPGRRRGDRRNRQRAEPARAQGHPAAARHAGGQHRRGSLDAAQLAQGGLRRWRHRAGRRDRDPRDGEGRRAARAIATYLDDGDWTGTPEG